VVTVGVGEADVDAVELEAREAGCDECRHPVESSPGPGLPDSPPPLGIGAQEGATDRERVPAGPVPAAMTQRTTSR
jgi:hypothetical protein